MPCYDHRDSASYIVEHELQPLKRTNEQLADRVNQYAQWMCWLLKDRDACWVDKAEMPADLAKWAKEHEAFDKERGA